MESNAAFLKSIIEVSHIEFQSYDIYHHKLVFSSGITRQILGYTEDEYDLLSQDFYKDLVHPDDRQILEHTIDSIVHSSIGEIIEMTIRCRRSDNNYIWIYSRQIVTERNANGIPCVVTRIAEDITELIRLRDQLSEKVAQLQAISYKNSHLLRNPVASIIGLINLVEEEHITNTHNMEIFNFLKQAVEKLDIVIHEINDLTE